MSRDPASVGPAPDGLLPCPFCGGNARTAQRNPAKALWFVQCDNCDASQHGQLGIENAITAWNTRAPHPDREAEPTGGVVREVLLLASYCGDSPACSDSRPCADCIAMCNVYRCEAPGEFVRELGVSVSPPVVEGSSLRDTQPGAEGAVVGWQPIETHDGSRDPVLLWFPDFAPDGVVVGFFRAAICDYYYPGQWLDDLNNEPFEVGKGEVFPTHWMPLPAAPDTALSDTQVGIPASCRDEPKDHHQPTTPGEQDIEDVISDAIGDSMDMDWTYRDGARSIMRAFEREGWVVMQNGASNPPVDAELGITTPGEQGEG